MKCGLPGGQQGGFVTESSPTHVREFWANLDATIAWMVRDLLLGRDIARAAAHLKKTDSLLYKWANPHEEQQPSLKQFLKLIQYTGNCEPLKQICAVCGLVALTRGTLGAMVRELLEIADA